MPAESQCPARFSSHAKDVKYHHMSHLMARQEVWMVVFVVFGSRLGVPISTKMGDDPEWLCPR